MGRTRIPKIPKEDKARDHRITMEIVVDAYDRDERAMGWFYHLENKVNFPVVCRCVAMRAISPLRVGDEVDVLGLAPQEECAHEIFVMMRWDRPEGLAVPLSQLEVVDADDTTREAVDDWHYWVRRGYEF